MRVSCEYERGDHIAKLRSNLSQLYAQRKRRWDSVCIGVEIQYATSARSRNTLAIPSVTFWPRFRLGNTKWRRCSCKPQSSGTGRRASAVRSNVSAGQNQAGGFNAELCWSCETGLYRIEAIIAEFFGQQSQISRQTQQRRIGCTRFRGQNGFADQQDVGTT